MHIKASHTRMHNQRLTRIARGYRVHASEVLKRYAPDETQATPASYHISSHNFNLDIMLLYGLGVRNTSEHSLCALLQNTLSV